MDFVVAPNDVARAYAAISQVDQNPLKLAARLAGLGEAEVRAGVPTWAWTLLGFGVGAALGVKYGPKLTALLKR